MKDADKKELLMVADTIETNGGWRVAAVKIRGFVEDYEKLESALREMLASCGPFVAADNTPTDQETWVNRYLLAVNRARGLLTPAETEGDGPKCKRCNQYLCMCPIKPPIVSRNL